MRCGRGTSAGASDQSKIHPARAWTFGSVSRLDSTHGELSAKAGRPRATASSERIEHNHRAYAPWFRDGRKMIVQELQSRPLFEIVFPEMTDPRENLVLRIDVQRQQVIAKPFVARLLKVGVADDHLVVHARPQCVCVGGRQIPE